MSTKAGGLTPELCAKVRREEVEYIRRHWMSTRVPREACPLDMSLHGGEVWQDEGRGHVVLWFVLELVSLLRAWVRDESEPLDRA